MFIISFRLCRASTLHIPVSCYYRNDSINNQKEHVRINLGFDLRLEQSELLLEKMIPPKCRCCNSLQNINTCVIWLPLYMNSIYVTRHNVSCVCLRDPASISGDTGVLHVLETPDDLDWITETGPHAPYMVLMETPAFTRCCYP